MGVKPLICIGFGAVLGAILRYVIQIAMPFTPNVFAFGTFLINMVGCFLIGFAFKSISHEFWRLCIITGFLGSFTTYSGLGLELFLYVQAKNYDLAILYGILSLIFGLIIVFLGYKCASLF